MMSDKNCRTKLCPFSFGVGIGVAKGILVMIFVWSAAMWNFGGPMMDLISVYPGVSATIGGGIIAGLWGLLDGFVFGLIAGFVYNCCLCKCCGWKKCEPGSGEGRL